MRQETPRQTTIVTIEVNGVPFTRAIAPAMTLLAFLRDELDLTGTKKGCDLGACGCCTVHLDGAPVLSCLLLACEAEGRSVTTIEGIADGPNLHPLQRAMVDQGAIQCGFCTPAMVMNGVYLLEHNQSPSATEIKECISGTICRCTGYTKIEKAIAVAAKALGDGEEV